MDSLRYGGPGLIPQGIPNVKPWKRWTSASRSASTSTRRPWASGHANGSEDAARLRPLRAACWNKVGPRGWCRDNGGSLHGISPGSVWTGQPGGTRTPYPELRRFVLYPDELRAVMMPTILRAYTATPMRLTDFGCSKNETQNLRQICAKKSVIHSDFKCLAVT